MYSDTNSLAATGCPAIQFNCDTEYLQLASDPASYRMRSLTRLLLCQTPATAGFPRLLPLFSNWATNSRILMPPPPSGYIIC